MAWKKGRGRLGVFEALLGRWVAEQDTERGHLRCTRRLAKVLEGKFLRLEVSWEFPGSVYEELAIIGVDPGDKTVRFWSFTSDGKRSMGTLADVSDLHPQAVGFEAQMDAGHARQAYWPAADGVGFHWVVESRTKKGWKRFVEHLYRPVDAD